MDKGIAPPEELLIPRPKRRREGSHLATFLAVTLFVHVIGFLWLSAHAKTFRVHLYNQLIAAHYIHIPPPPPPKPKPLPPPPKPKTPPANKPVAQAPPPPLKLHQTHFHVSRNAPKSNESSGLVASQETKGGSEYGNPEGVPGGKGTNVQAPVTRTAPTTAAPVPPPTTKPAGPTTDAKAITQVEPTIPSDLQSEDYQSFVRVQVIINPDGTFTVTLLTSSGNADVDRRVLEALQRWKWQPALKDGVAIRSIQIFRFEFQVE